MSATLPNKERGSSRREPGSRLPTSAWSINAVSEECAALLIAGVDSLRRPPLQQQIIQGGQFGLARECPVAILTLFPGGDEMADRAICAALLLASLPIAGCGTVANLARQGPEKGEKIPFGGVKHDVSYIKETTNGEGGSPPCSSSEQCRKAALRLFCAADLPFSLVGDVVTWPYTATYTYINQPTPTPPMRLAPAPAGTQVTAEGRPQTSP